MWNDKDRAIKGAAITPSNSVVNEYDALYVGGTGNLKVQLAAPEEDWITLYNVQAGTFLPICTKYVSSDSTATYIVGFKIQ